MCKRTKHLSIQDDCWIFRIQAEDFTRGGDTFRGVELRPPSELCPGVEEDAELKWGHLKFLALTHPPPPLKIYIVFCS